MPLASDGAIEINNNSGAVDIEGTSDSGPSVVDVRAEKIVRATTEQTARDLLRHVVITYLSAPGQVTLQTERITGILIGVSFEINYHVKVPASARIQVRTSNGTLSINGVSGRVKLNDTNGAIIAKAIGGGFEARTTNGMVDVDIAKGGELVDLRAVNGSVHLALPANVNANLSATSVNGAVEVTGLPFENFGDAARDARRVRGRINAGGPPIELNAINGSVRVTAR